MSDDVVAAELSAYRPDLIVLAFGTNEGFSPVLTAGEAETTLRTQVARIRRLSDRDVPILLLGAPDAAAWAPAGTGDRKSTRLNSSHLVISYAVFCLKK